MAVGAPRIFEMRHTPPPSASRDKDHAIPKIVTPLNVFRLCTLRQRQQFVNFVPLARSRTPLRKSIGRATVTFARQLKCARPEQNPRAIEAIGDAKTARQFHRFAHRRQVRAARSFCNRRHNHRPELRPMCTSHLPNTFAADFLRISESLLQSQRCAGRFFRVVLVVAPGIQKCATTPSPSAA